MLKQMARCKAVSAISFDQCVFGAPAVKPTTFILARFQHFRILALQSGCGGRCPHGPGAHVALAGKEAGGFKTSRAKVYPPAMNQAIAAAFHVYVHRLQPVQAATTLPTQLKELNVDEIKEISEVQPDFHG